MAQAPDSEGAAMVPKIGQFFIDGLLETSIRL